MVRQRVGISTAGPNFDSGLVHIRLGAILKKSSPAGSSVFRPLAQLMVGGDGRKTEEEVDIVDEERHLGDRFCDWGYSNAIDTKPSKNILKTEAETAGASRCFEI